MRLTLPGRGSRTAQSGSRTTLTLAIAIILTALIGVGVHAMASSAPPKARPAADAKYGGLPSWLPKPKVQVGRIVQASATHPKLGIEGDTIIVHTGQATVTATAVGPQVPEEGQFPVPKTSPCTFDVTFTRATGTITLRRHDFTVLDELGHLHYLKVTGLHGKRAAEVIRPGATVTLVMSAVLPTGSGTLRWSPTSPKPIVS